MRMAQDWMERMMFRAQKYLTMEQLEQLRSDLTIVFADYNVQVTETALTAYDNRDDECYKMFFIAKEMQGLALGRTPDHCGGEGLLWWVTLFCIYLHDSRREGKTK